MYSNEEIDDLMRILDEVGIKSAKSFTVIGRSCLEAQNVKPAIAGILMNAYGDKAQGGDKKARTIEDIKTALSIVQAITSILASLTSTVHSGLNAHSTRVNLARKS